jgi:hypothetical protein
MTQSNVEERKKKMNGQTLSVKGAPLLLALLFAMSCQSSKPTSTSAVPSLPATRAASAANDYTKPYLTDDKMQKFLASMQEEHNPLELIFRPGGQTQNPASMNERIDEFNSFAHKYGFRDYQDYTSVWGRITAGEMQLWGAQTFEDMISGAHAELKKSDLAPEMRKVYEDQITSSQKALDDLNKKNTSVNAADMELVKKYKDQIDAARKKYAAAS